MHGAGNIANEDVKILFEKLSEETRRLLDAGESDLSPVLGELLMIAPGRIAVADHAANFLHLLGFLSRGQVDEGKVWQWAKDVAAGHPSHGGVLSLLASLGDLLREKNDSEVAKAITLPMLDEIFRRAMQVAPDQPGAFARAGLFYLNNANLVEAERCLQRAFDLEPRNAFVAIQLSDLLARIGRPVDGLNVLELSITKAEPNAELLWKGGLAATSLSRSEFALNFMTTLAEIEPDRRWVNYYRAIALLDLNRFQEAAAAIDLEAKIIAMPSALHVHTVRAAASAGLGDPGKLRLHLEAAVALPLGLVNYLEQAGVVGCFTRLWAAAGHLPADDPTRIKLHNRILYSGLTPAAYWDQIRAGRDKIKGVRHFWVDLRQPLDDRWISSGSAMPGQERWSAYAVRYGVLAADETQAAKSALDWQARSAHLPAVIVSVAVDSGPFTDVPGITQRSYPRQSE